MKWKKRCLELMRLRAKHGKDRSLARPFPDLSVEKRTSPTSDRMRTPPVLDATNLEKMLGSEFSIKFTQDGYKVEKK